MSFPGIECANIWGYVDTLGNEYALVGTEDGVRIIDVTNPAAPVQKFAIPGNTSFWREIKTWGKYAFVTTEAASPNPGIQIINLSNLPASVSTKFWRGTGAINNLLTKAHALHAEAGYLYLYGSNLFGGAPLIVNLQPDPWNPVYTGYCSNGAVSAYVHDGYVRNDTLFAGHIYGGYFAVWNVANKSSPQLVAYQSTPGAFTHNTWLTDNSRILLTTDEVSNSYLTAYDISDPSNIKELDRIQSQFPASGSIVHNTHVRNDFAITSWYRDGITIVDASRRGNLVTTGYYDCNSSLAGNGFNSVWGVYPFLPSGTIVASDIEQGLFVFTPTYVRACYLEGIVTDSISGSALGNVSVQIISTQASDLTKITGEYKTGYSAAGNYSVQFSKAGYQSKIINNVTLTNDSLTILNAELVPLISFTLNGTVRSIISGAMVASANVKFENSNYTYNAVTNAAGGFSITGFYSGTYEMTSGKWLYKNKCQNLYLSPASSPMMIQLDTGIYDDFAFNYGWTVTGTASTGAWVRAVPAGTTYITPGDANPGSDVTDDCSKLCFLTGNGGGSIGFDDVDNGTAVLTSPPFNLTGMPDPYLNYSRWFFNIPSSNPANDTLRVSVTNGISTVILENVVASTLPGMSQWVSRSFRVLSYIAPTANMRLIIYTADQNATPNTLEAAFDFFSVTNSSPLPVALVSFTASAYEDFNFLEWTTHNEINNLGFTILKSADGIEFAEIGFIKGHGTSTLAHSYQFKDYDLSRNPAFYRLMQTDFNGSVTYSKVIIVKRNHTHQFADVYPNPFTDFLFVKTGQDASLPAELILKDLSGKIIFNQNLVISSSGAAVNVSFLTSGYYFAELISAGGSKKFKLVKL